MDKQTRSEREFETDLRDRMWSCDWHSHSVFHRCRNGLTVLGYLSGGDSEAERANYLLAQVLEVAQRPRRVSEVEA